MSLLDTASLIVTPNGYKEGTLYSVIPSDGSGDMSVVRATTATRVNSAGLVELVPYNLLSWSEQFDNAYWQKSSATITANTTTAPDGTSTADTLTITSGGYLLQQLTLFPAVSGQSVTISIYTKNQITDFLLFGGATASGTDTYTITDSGNGWYRHTRTRVFTTTTSVLPVQFIIYDQVGNNFIWGAQLVEGSTAKDYQKTETRLNIPRLDYSNGTCPSLLVEPQRTNNFQYSSQFDNAYWTKVAATVTANNIVSPSGIQDAEKVEFNSGYINGTVTVADNQTYTISFFAKKGTANLFQISEAFYVGTTVAFDLNTGTVTSGTGSIEDYGNGWYRCSMQFTYGVGQVVASWLVRNYQTGYIYLWGAQLEAGSYPTSYIPTTSASVTRNADVVSKTGISSLIGQTEGTVFLDYIWNNNANDVIPIAINGDGGKFVWFRLNGVQFYGNGGSLVFDYSPSNGVYNQRYKLAFVYGQNDFRVFMNGVLVASQTSGTFSGAFNEILFTPIGSTPYNDSTKHNAISLWKTKLTNTQLAQLTTI